MKWTGEAFRFLSSNAAKPAMTLFDHELSLRPSFRIETAFGRKRKEITKTGDTIIRQASSEHFTEETFEQRFQRILKRRSFDTLSNIVKTFDRTPVQLVTALFASTSFAQFVQRLDGDLETTAENLLDAAVMNKAFSEEGVFRRLRRPRRCFQLDWLRLRFKGSKSFALTQTPFRL